MMKAHGPVSIPQLTWNASLTVECRRTSMQFIIYPRSTYWRRFKWHLLVQWAAVTIIDDLGYYKNDIIVWGARVEQVLARLSGDKLEGNFREQKLTSYNQSQPESLHRRSLHCYAAKVVYLALRSARPWRSSVEHSSGNSHRHSTARVVSVWTLMRVGFSLLGVGGEQRYKLSELGRD